MWAGGQVTTNPLAGTVLADTGPLDVGHYDVALVLNGSSDFSINFQRRSAANDATLQTIGFLASAPITVLLVPKRIRLLKNERVRVTNVADLTFAVNVSIFYDFVGQ